MRRRNFIFGAGVAGSVLLLARAQQAAATVIGLLSSGGEALHAERIAAFRHGLLQGGYGEGASVAIEPRWADGHYDRLPALAAELVRRRVAVIVASGGNGPALAAKAVTAEIPIVFVSGGEPVKAGLVASLARPGGNVTGVSWIAARLSAKRLELLHQLVGKVDLIGVLMNPDYSDADAQRQELTEAAHAIDQRIEIAEARSDGEIERAIVALTRAHADALFVANDPFYQSRADVIVAFAQRQKLPACYPDRAFAAAGGLVSYGASLIDMWRQAGTYTARVLKGEKPADLPVLQPTTFELVVNLNTAKALGLEVPPTLIARADEVIE
jgi:putative ABC transport system substrate-binding protein